MALRDGAVRLITCVSYTNYAIISRSFVDAPFHCRRPRVPCSFCADCGHGTVYHPTSRRRHHRCQRPRVTSRQFTSLQATPEASLAHDHFLAVTRVAFVLYVAFLTLNYHNQFFYGDDNDDDDDDDDDRVFLTQMAKTTFC